MLIGSFFFTQKKTDNDTEILKELGNKACQCSDSIRLMNREKKEILNDLNNCIDKQTGALQMASLLLSAKDLEQNAPTVNGKKQINLNFNTNKNSQQYKDSYNKIEKYLMKNCLSTQNAVATSETKSNKFTRNEKALELYEKGDKEFKKQNWKEAIKFFELSLKVDPSFVYAWDNLGISYRQLGEYDNAINAYKSSLMIDPKGRMPLQNIPVAYIYKKEYQKAIDAYLELDKVYPGDAEVYYGIGNIYATALNEDEKALTYLCKAYKIYTEEKSPYKADAGSLIGIVYKRMKEQNKVDQFKQILKNNNINFE